MGIEKPQKAWGCVTDTSSGRTVFPPPKPLISTQKSRFNRSLWLFGHSLRYGKIFTLIHYILIFGEKFKKTEKNWSVKMLCYFYMDPKFFYRG